MVMRNVFGLKSASLYEGEDKVFNEFADVSGIIGHDESLSGGIKLSGLDGISLLKTHGIPQYGNKAIYIVRYGRASMVSYYHYMRDFAQSALTLEQIINGEAWPGLWSEHAMAWAPITRKDTLLIKCEKLRDDNVVVRKVYNRLFVTFSITVAIF